MLRARILTALVLSCGLLAALFLLPARGAVLVFGAAFTVGAWEWAGFGGLTRLLARTAYALGVVLLMILSWQWTDNPSNTLILLGCACGWWVIAFLWLSLRPNGHDPLLTLVCGVPVLVPSFAALARIQVVKHSFARGPQIVLFMLLLVFAADIGAFFAGRSLGRRKLAPRVSPAKTWEGAAGGMFGVSLVAWLGALHFGLPVPASIAFGCAIGIFSIVGDLTESMFKRQAGLKDSGSLLPGHGGVLDRIDSVTAAAPLCALGLLVTGALK
jgi:phosphatidate cytidylyltransferase